MKILPIRVSLVLSKALETTQCLLQGFKSFKHLKHAHARLLRLGLDQDHYLLNMVLRSGFDFGHANYSCLIFHQTTQPNIFLWNTMIRGLVSADCFDGAIQFYSSMRTKGFLPNRFTFPFVLKACARRSDFYFGLNIHTLVVKTGFDFDVYVKTSVCTITDRATS
ncbi:hypothetical protein L3X38_025647 [Prunus dulcis]|uniref:Pentatricopeptide repeat-containing protein n=1 Tax=Prunus dulcis TaxID=3755 RepID=A0AAD4Z7L8_PRUDU|nr:hypothetical protein L3X38_025647 [Prunus dulcis]